MTLCIIPARLDSQRFPRKVLTAIAGRELILRVVDTCIACDRLTQIVILAHDQEICDVVSKEYKSVSMVSVKLHLIGESGTHRAFDYYYANNQKINMVVVQADNIGLTTRDLDTVVYHANSINDKSIYTPVCEMTQDDAALTSNVKVALGGLDNILYFSRSCIPHGSCIFSKHVGVYMFPASLLNDATFMMHAMNRDFNYCDLANKEKLEQLAWLYFGFSMRAVRLLGHRDSIDTPDDMKSYIKNYYATRSLF